MSGLCLNTMTVRQAQKAFKKRATWAMLYYIREYDDTPMEDEAVAEIEQSAEQQAQKKELEALLEIYKDVFRAELPEQLPPKRTVDHRINTGDSAPVNTNAYPLSAQQLKEQLKQIHDLLEKGLI